MSNAAKVTVVIPNYNGLKFMEPCFKALEMQICRDFEILVVDNGSGDGSVEWLKEHEIPSIFLETNTGVAEGAGDPVDLSSGKHRLFRCCKCGDQGGKDALCASVKQ